ncbi:hypothetical protein ABZW32_34780 [Streptomyces sp. NPDC004667]|uniref:hypothetical protein n=1 Tax=Streptomyces sp. NPDC004667 TaxID=3154285 RepID=UPI00339F5F21
MPNPGDRAPRRPSTGSRARAAWLAYLCPGHAVDLNGWPGAAEHPDTGTMPCGTVLDYRSSEQQLQSHADLWLTPLTGVDPAAHDGWADVLDQADRTLLARVDTGAATPRCNRGRVAGLTCGNTPRSGIQVRVAPRVAGPAPAPVFHGPCPSPAR